MHTFKYAQWTITGSSIASDQTCLLVKELGVCFDIWDLHFPIVSRREE